MKKSNNVVFRPCQKNSTTIPRLMFLTIKALKRLLLNVKLQLNILDCQLVKIYHGRPIFTLLQTKLEKQLG